MFRYGDGNVCSQLHIYICKYRVYTEHTGSVVVKHIVYYSVLCKLDLFVYNTL